MKLNDFVIWEIHYDVCVNINTDGTLPCICKVPENFSFDSCAQNMLETIIRKPQSFHFHRDPLVHYASLTDI